MSHCPNPQQHEKHLCKLTADGVHRDQPEAYARLVHEPKYACKGCGRVAVDAESLCTPVRLGTFEEG